MNIGVEVEQLPHSHCEKSRFYRDDVAISVITPTLYYQLAAAFRFSLPARPVPGV